MESVALPEDTPPQQPDFVDIVIESAIEAEYATGHREATDKEARRGIILRVLRIIGGFFLIGAGIAALVLPGSGWLLIIMGLSLLPFAWARRTVRLVRSKVPGIPEEGRIPTRTWVIMGASMVLIMTLSVLYGDQIASWISSLWGDPEKLFT